MTTGSLLQAADLAHDRGPLVGPLALCLLLLPLAAGCPAADDGPCAEASVRIAFPSPSWGSAEAFGPPDTDAAAGLLLDADHPWPTWYDELGELRGWSRRQTVVVPLEALPSPAEVVLSGVHFFGVSEAQGEPEELDLNFEAHVLPEGEAASLVIVPREPVPAGTVKVIVTLDEGAVGAAPLPVCGADGLPDPAYLAARKRWPRRDRPSFALAYPVSAIGQQLAALHANLSRTPSYSVESAELRAIDGYGIALPAGVIAGARAQTATGLLRLADHAGPDRTFVLDADGVPTPQGESLPGFLVTLPKTGTAPFPVVFYQHGAEGQKTDLLEVAGPLSQAGFALVAIDLPYHGDRGSGSGLMAMIDFADPLATRDAIRQAAIDQMTVLTHLELLDAAVTPLLAPGEVSVLDGSRLFFVGSSMGAVSGSTTFALSPEVQGAGLFVGGAGFSDLASYGLFGYFVSQILDRPELERTTVLGLLDALVEGGDAFAHAGMDVAAGGSPRPALFFQAIGDGIVDPVATESLARAFSADQVDPVDHPVPGMDRLSVPASQNATVGGGKTTRLLLHFPNREGLAGAEWHGALVRRDDAQTLAAACFTALLGGEACAVKDDAFGRDGP